MVIKVSIGGRAGPRQGYSLGLDCFDSSLRNYFSLNATNRRYPFGSMKGFVEPPLVLRRSAFVFTIIGHPPSEAMNKLVHIQVGDYRAVDRAAALPLGCAE